MPNCVVPKSQRQRTAAATEEAEAVAAGDAATAPLDGCDRPHWTFTLLLDSPIGQPHVPSSDPPHRPRSGPAVCTTATIHSRGTNRGRYVARAMAYTLLAPQSYCTSPSIHFHLPPCISLYPAGTPGCSGITVHLDVSLPGRSARLYGVRNGLGPIGRSVELEEEEEGQLNIIFPVSCFKHSSRR